MPIAKTAIIKLQKILHEDKWIIADTVDIFLDNGKEIKNFLRITAKNGGYVVVVPRLSDGRFLLTRQYKPVAGLTIEGVAGSREDGESWEEAACREMLEETGFVPGELLSIGEKFYPLSDRADSPCHLFIAFDCKPSDRSAVADEVQGIERIFLKPVEVDELIHRGEIKDLATLAGILAHYVYDQRKSEGRS